VIGLREPVAQLAEAPHQRAAARRQLGERLAPADRSEHVVGGVLPDHRLGDDRPQLAPCPLPRLGALIGSAHVLVALDRDHQGIELVRHREFAARASSTKHRQVQSTTLLGACRGQSDGLSPRQTRHADD
jgi:hypothetical protein